MYVQDGKSLLEFVNSPWLAVRISELKLAKKARTFTHKTTSALIQSQFGDRK